MTCECGLTYFASCPADVLRHEKQHDEYLNGVRFALTPEDEILSEGNPLKVSVVRPSSPLALKERAEHVARRANLETHYTFGVYSARDSSNQDLSIHVFVGSKNERAVALMLLEKRASTALKHWANSTLEIVEGVDRWTIGFIWVLPSFRRTGIAKILLREACRFTGLTVEELAWYEDFSPEGELLVRSVCPDRFWTARGESERQLLKHRITAIIEDLF